LEYRHWFWKDEPVYEPPAVRVVTFRYTGLKKATLTLDANLYWVKPESAKATFNETVLGVGSEAMHKTYDVTNLVRSGDNTLKLDYQVVIPQWPQGRVTAYVDVEADVALPTEIQLPWWFLPVALVAALGGVILIGGTIVIDRLRGR